MEQDDHIEVVKKKILDGYKHCRTCNVCYGSCPLYETSRGFLTKGPSGILSAMYYAISWNLLKGEKGKALRDILYSCTTCGSCNIRCKSSATATPVVETIEAGRQLLVELMQGPSPTHSNALKSLLEKGNPYDESPADRLNWIKELDKGKKLNYYRTPGEGAVEVLLFVGCTPSYNTDLWKIANSIVMILERLEISYGILKDEKCCGSPAKRLGEECLFEELSEENLKAFESVNAETIVTISPHCFNTFINEYPDGMKQFDVKHYTDYFAKLIDEGRIVPKINLEKKVTYQDPCYLGKKNSHYDAPRKILKQIPGLRMMEMKRNRENSLCCGGGGGRMWMDVEEVIRLSEIRITEALAVEAQVLATACPWCYIQMGDAIKDTHNEGKIEIKDISELLLSSISGEIK